MSERPVNRQEVVVTPHRLGGSLQSPAKARGLVLFAHGGGSSRFSPRNNMVADRLNKAGFATLLFDLLSDEESRDRRNVFDIPLLAGRLSEAAAWVRQEPSARAQPIGYFGASTGAAAALVAAADKGADVKAAVSRGGRPDLAGPDVLARVKAPTLLIVGERDAEVLSLNRHALSIMTCEARLDVVPGATHLFEEPGTLEKAADLAVGWFSEHLAPAGEATAPPIEEN